MKQWSFGKVVFATFLGVFLAIALACGVLGALIRGGADEAERANNADRAKHGLPPIRQDER